MSEDRGVPRELKSAPLKKHKDISRDFPRRVIAVHLGIICLLLLLKSTGLGYLFFQYSSGCKIEDKKLKNEENASSPEVGNHSVLPLTGGWCFREKICAGCFGNWSCYGENCYCFSKDVKTWDESKTSCEGCHSSLITIDDEEEQGFIGRKIQDHHWIGYYTKEDNDTWEWLNNSELFPKTHFQLNTTDANCGQINSTNITSTNCSAQHHYICEKSIFSCC